jgi:hypothetical protein
VTGVAPLPGGGFFAVGNEFNEPTVAYVLGADGRADRRFRSITLGPGSYGGSPVSIGGGLADVVYGVSRGPREEFGYRPVLARFHLPTGGRR